MPAMIQRALLIWLGILLLANINGAVRELWLIPALGPTPGRALSTILLSAVVFLVSWLSITWIAPLTPHDALLVGTLWLVLTLAFEFLVGHYVFHKPWAELTEDYHVLRGRIWPLVLLVVLFGPLSAGHLRRLW
jgi:hypothetical protein